jgi:hypothetical protein
MGMIWKVECNDGTRDEGNPSKAPCVNNGGIKPINFDLSKPFLGKPDLSQQIAQQQAQMEIARQQAIEKANANIQKPRTFIEMNQGYIIIGLVLVVSYFAYKKFKK